MTNSVAGWIRTSALAAIFVAGLHPALAQNLTFFREYNNTPQPEWHSSGFASDGKGTLYVFIGDTLRKYDSTGAELWNKQIGIFPTLGALHGLAVNAGGVFVAGGTLANVALPGQTIAGKSDAFVRRYDPDGHELWTREFGTPGINSTVQVLAADAAGVYVAGVTWNGSQDTPPAPFASRLDANGKQLWTTPFFGAAGLVNASADSVGFYVASGNGPTPWLFRFDLHGSWIWTRQLEPIPSSLATVAADESGAYVLGNFGLSGFLGLSRYDQAGSELWTRKISNWQPLGVAADSSGAFVIGVTDRALPGQCYAGTFDFFLIRYSSAGDQMWTREFGTAWGDNPLGVDADSTGVYVYGWHQGNLGPDGSPAPPSTYLAKFEKSSSPVTGSQPRIQSECVLNAASYLGGAVAPGEIVTIFGSAMGPLDLARFSLTPDGRLPTTLAGVRILFDGEAAPLLYVSDNQSSAIVPYDVAGKTNVNVQVEYNGVRSSAVGMAVLQSRIGVFTLGSSGEGPGAIHGPGAILNEDGTINSPKNPAARGSVVSIYATGAGLPQTPGADDQITGNGPSSLKQVVHVNLTSDGSCEDFPGFPAEVLYYGGAPESVPGLVQINVRLPLDVPTGDAAALFFRLSPGTTVEETVTIALR
jgi:uncharacterized protein (TIGR03437 family)